MIIDIRGTGSGAHYLPLGDLEGFCARKIDMSVMTRAHVHPGAEPLRTRRSGHGSV